MANTNALVQRLVATAWLSDRTIIYCSWWSRGGVTVALVGTVSVTLALIEIVLVPWHWQVCQQTVAELQHNTCSNYCGIGQ